jgi:cbb3-type cytochrome oxidase subunit 3
MKKFTPLLILSIFLVGVVWMIFGMKNAMDVTDHSKVRKAQATEKKQ